MGTWRRRTPLARLTIRIAAGLTLAAMIIVLSDAVWKPIGWGLLLVMALVVPLPGDYSGELVHRWRARRRGGRERRPPDSEQ